MQKAKTKSPFIAVLLAGVAAVSLVGVPSAKAQDLISSLKSAYETNPRIKTQRKVLEGLDEDVAQAISGWRPTITADYSKGRQRTSNDGSPWIHSDTEDRILTVDQPLFRGGGTLARTESANERVTAGRFRLLNTEQEVLLDAVTAYMDVVRDNSVLELSKSNVEVLGRQLQASRDRFDVGEVTRTDVAQSEARQARAQAEATQAEGNLAASRATFERVIGFKPENPQAPVALPTLPSSLEEAMEIATKLNPLMLENFHAEKAAQSDVDIAIASLLPEVSLRGQMRRAEGEGFSGASEFDNDTLTVNVGIPLYQSGAE